MHKYLSPVSLFFFFFQIKSFILFYFRRDLERDLRLTDSEDESRKRMHRLLFLLTRKMLIKDTVTYD